MSLRWLMVTRLHLTSSALRLVCCAGAPLKCPPFLFLPLSPGSPQDRPLSSPPLSNQVALKCLQERKETKICKLPVPWLREHSVICCILCRNSKLASGRADSFVLEAGGKGAPVTTGVYFQDHFKAMMLVHQHSRVSRIAWLCS